MWAGAFAQIGRGGPEDSRAARSYYEKAAALGNEDAKTRLKNMDCPYVLKDKRGNRDDASLLLAILASLTGNV